MSFLASIPVWAYFVILALMFMTTHLLAMKPDRTPKRGTAIAGGLGSSLLLLLGLITVNGEVPGSVLLALAAAAAGGVVSGLTARPPKQRAK